MLVLVSYWLHYWFIVSSIINWCMKRALVVQVFFLCLWIMKFSFTNLWMVYSPQNLLQFLEPLLRTSSEGRRNYSVIKSLRYSENLQVCIKLNSSRFIVEYWYPTWLVKKSYKTGFSFLTMSSIRLLLNFHCRHSFVLICALF